MRSPSSSRDRGEGFLFGYVLGIMDCREATKLDKPCIEWTWSGNDEMDPAQGRGRAVLDGDRLKGMIFFHQVDESEFVAEREGIERS